MTLAIAGNSAGSYNITKSLRFRSSATAYLNRTPSSASNLKTWTWSAWIKRGTLGSFCDIFSTGPSATNSHHVYFYASDQIGFEYYNVTYDYYVASTGAYRDPAAWYHVVAVWDTTQATASNRMKLYVNNVLINNIGSTNYPTQNYDGYVNTTNTHRFGTNNTAASNYFDGYLAEVNFIDGQALTPSSFGSTNATTGVWQPAKYTGTYGTNGFYLPFTNTTSTTTLGYDFSGNGNNWTTNNISLTSGVTYDSMTDTPSLLNSTTANYAVLNPLNTTSGTFSDGNLYYYGPSSWRTSVSTISLPTTGKFYCEATVSGSPYSPRDATSAYGAFGILKLDSAFNNTTAPLSTTAGLFLCDSGYYNNFAGSATNSGSTLANGDVIGLAVDLGANTYTFYKNNTSLISGTIGTASGTPFVFAIASYNTSYGTFKPNFGQRPFAYTAPSGYLPLNTFNLPNSTVLAGNKYMDATTYTGNGSTLTVTNAGGFKPDFVWGKCRSTTLDNYLYDSIRGAGYYLISDTTGAESTFAAGGLTSFNSNGFSLGSGSGLNGNGYTNVGWQWQAGQGTTSSNTNGSITSTVSVNPTAGFSIATYTGNGTNNATVGHGLGVTPAMIIVKNRTTGSTFWPVYHKSFSSNYVCWLNSTLPTQSIASTANGGIGSVSSSIFTCINGTSGAGEVNTNTNNYVAYCWSEIAGFSQFGSYTGNGSTNGPFIYTGFRPKFIMIKCSSSSMNWVILDTSRSVYNAAGNLLYPNTSDAEGTLSSLDILSNGFKLRDATGGWINNSGSTFIYAAFAENPFKNALAR